MIFLLSSVCGAVFLLAVILLARLGDEVAEFADFVASIEGRGGRVRFCLRLVLYAGTAGAVGLFFGLGVFKAAAILVWLIALEYSAYAWILIGAFKRGERP